MTSGMVRQRHGRRLWHRVGFLVVVLLVAALGAQAATSGAERVFQTELGELRVKGTPQRVVALVGQGIDSLAALDLKPVGIPELLRADYLGDFLKGVPSVGSYQNPSIEMIRALKPDLIIVDATLYHGVDYVKLKAIAPVLGMRADHYKEALDQLLLLGRIVGREEKARQFVAQFNQRIAEVKSKLPAGRPVSVLAMFGDSENFSMWLDNSFVGSVLTALGADYSLKVAQLTSAEKSGANAKNVNDYRFVRLSLEKLVELDPDVIFLFSKEGEPLSQAWARNPVWKHLSAVKAGRVYELDRNLWSRTRGPVAASLMFEEGARLLYPGAARR